MEARTYSVSEVASVLKLNYMSVQNMVRHKRLPFHHAEHRRIEFPADQIDQLALQRYEFRQQELGLCTITEFATATGLHSATVRRYCRDGVVESFTDPFSHGKQRFLRRADIARIVKLQPKKGRPYGHVE